MMELLNKFSEIKVDNSKRLPPEDMEFCKLEEKVFNNAYNAYSTAYNSVKIAFEEQKKLVGENHGYIWEYTDCGINELREKLISLKSSFIGKIVNYLNKKYHTNLSMNNKFDGSTYHRDLDIDSIALEEVLDEYIFERMDGLNFTEYAIKQAIEKNKIECQTWNKWYEKWNYEVKGKIIRFSCSITGQIPILYFYDNNEKELCSELQHNKIDCITKYKNGNTAVKFLSEEYALIFAKKYLGYIEMTDEEREKIKDK